MLKSQQLSPPGFIRRSSCNHTLRSINLPVYGTLEEISAPVKQNNITPHKPLVWLMTVAISQRGPVLAGLMPATTSHALHSICHFASYSKRATKKAHSFKAWFIGLPGHSSKHSSKHGNELIDGLDNVTAASWRPYSFRSSIRQWTFGNSHMGFLSTISVRLSRG